MATFEKTETIGEHAHSLLKQLRQRFRDGEEKQTIIDALNRELGDSVEKVLLIKSILDASEGER